MHLYVLQLGQGKYYVGLARLMDAGIKLSGKVSKIKDPEDGEYPWDALSVDIFLDENGSYLLSTPEKPSRNPSWSLSKNQSKNPGDGFFSKISGLLHTTFSGGMNKSFSREIFLAHDPALEYYKLPNLKRVLCKMKVGDKVQLRREQDHENDKMAIVVLNKRKRKLGYIPRSHNVILSRLMEAGKHIYGVASKIDYEKDGVGGHNSITIDVYMED